jgi:hypothetical protein
MANLRYVWKVMLVIGMILNVEVGDAVDSPTSDGVNVRNGTSLGTSHLDPRSANSGKTPLCQTGVFPHISSKED